MSITSKLALVAALSTLVAAPAFAIDQQASLEALEQVAPHTGVSGAYASVDRAPRAQVREFRSHRIAQPAYGLGDFQSVGGH
jgi:hypothetical protein